MNIAIFGHTGQIGGEIRSLLKAILPDIDVTNANELIGFLHQTKPDIIINAAAYTNVDAAEENKDLAFLTNATAPRIMAKAAKDSGALLIHFSTDYVFDGTGDTPWTEDSPLSPLNVYGTSKAEGDEAIIQSGCRHLIIRTSWIYSVVGENFIKTILRLAQNQNELRVVSDQIGAPNSAEFIARTTLHAINKTIDNPDLQGVYHLSTLGETSWFEFAKFIVTESGINPACQFIPVTSFEYKSAARRPLNARLDTLKFQRTFEFIPPDWKSEVRQQLPAILKNL